MEALCLMFSGQAVQEKGMCAALWRLPEARGVLERLTPILGEDLERLTSDAPDEELQLTYNTQRAIHAHHLGHWLAYEARHPGIVLDGVIGHSMGVVAALAAAGALTVEGSARFIAARARAFAEVCKGLAAPMGLGAVASDSFDDLLDELKAFPDLSLALRNTVTRGVIGGPLASLQALADKAQAEDWPVKVRVLRVEGPYHTAAFAPCKEDLRRALENVEIRPPRIPVFMGTSGRLEEDPVRIRRLLVDQADSPELHLDAVRAAHAHGCRRFLEVSHKPQPVTWLSDQLVDAEGRLLPGVEGRAVPTAEI